MSAADPEQLLPHRGAMMLIGSITTISSDSAVTSAVVTDAWPLRSGNSVSSIVLVELAAQTAGVLSCWKKREHRSAFVAGMLTGIKSAEFYIAEVPVNAELITTATAMYGIDDYEAMEATVMMGSMCLCKVQLQVFSQRAETVA